MSKPTTVSGGKQDNKAGELHNSLVYVKQHWQLYVVFLLPALALTLIFKYIPMGGILIAFQDYNPFRGILRSEWVGFAYFQRFLSSPDFMSYLANTLKLSVYGLLWGFPVPIILAFLLNRIQSTGLKKNTACTVFAELHLRHRSLRYCQDHPLRDRSGQSAVRKPDQLYDHAGSMEDHLYRKRYLAGSRLGIHHVYSRPCERKPGSAGGSRPRRSQYPAADQGGGMACHQRHRRDPVHPAGRKYHEHRFRKAYALQTDLNLASSEIISTYVYKQGLISGNFSFSTAVGLFNTVINVILLLSVNKIVAKMNDGQGL